jgi:hypothetical protein
MPQPLAAGTLDQAALVDGAVLVNRPFAPAMALASRPSRREVDRRFVYLDPAPTIRAPAPLRRARPGRVSLGHLRRALDHPARQPIRDNLEALERQSRERQRVRAIVENLKPEIEDTVVRLFGHTLFFDRPSQAPDQLARPRSRPPPSRPVLPFTAMRKSSWPGSSPIWPP